MRDYLWCKGKPGFQNFLTKLARTLYSEIWSRIPPTPLEMKSQPDLGTLSFDYYRTHNPPPPNRSWHFEFWLLQNTPSPKLKFRQILALWVSTTTEHPIPLPSLLPENWNLGRSRHFEFWQLQNPPPHYYYRQGCSWSMWRLIAVSPKDTISLIKFYHIRLKATKKLP